MWVQPIGISRVSRVSEAESARIAQQQAPAAGEPRASKPLGGFDLLKLSMPQWPNELAAWA
jgi:hypothetical protein